MKKIILLIIILFIAEPSFAQIELKGIMGINFISFPSLQDYINETYAPPNAQLGTFNSAVIFSVEVGYFIGKDFELSIEFPYQIYSYTEIVGLGQYELAYNSFLSSVLAYYVLSGEGYNFKFGGGVGPRFVSGSETKRWQGTEDSFSSVGFGGLLRIEGNTALAENVFANIGFDLRYDVNGEPEDDDGNKLTNPVKGENVNFDTFTFGVKLGISYLIGGTN
jgi:hypothetical protein